MGSRAWLCTLRKTIQRISKNVSPNYGDRVLVKKLLPMQEKETAKFLLRLLERPDAFIEHARQCVEVTALSRKRIKAS